MLLNLNRQKKTVIGILLIAVSAGCLRAKKSAFDIRSPSGVIFEVGIFFISAQTASPSAPASVSSSFSYY